MTRDEMVEAIRDARDTLADMEDDTSALKHSPEAAALRLRLRELEAQLNRARRAEYNTGGV